MIWKWKKNQNFWNVKNNHYKTEKIKYFQNFSKDSINPWIDKKKRTKDKKL